MSDPTTYPAAPTPPVQPGPFGGQPGPVATPPKAPPAGVSPPPAPKEPTIKDRASGLLATMTDAQRHNAPITPWMLTELAAVVGKVTGEKAPTPLHPTLDMRGLPTTIFARKADGSPLMVDSAEEALAYVRTLPTDVQARPHWVAADNALVEATGSVPGTDVSPAIRLFSAALAEDRKVDAKPVEIKDKPVDEAKQKAQAQQTKDNDDRTAAAKSPSDAKAQPATLPLASPQDAQDKAKADRQAKAKADYDAAMKPDPVPAV
jgi:hypothetical protein